MYTAEKLQNARRQLPATARLAMQIEVYHDEAKGAMMAMVFDGATAEQEQRKGPSPATGISTKGIVIAAACCLDGTARYLSESTPPGEDRMGYDLAYMAIIQTAMRMNGQCILEEHTRRTNPRRDDTQAG